MPMPRGATGAPIPGLTQGRRPSLPSGPEQILDPNKLPEGYIVPPEPPEWLTTTEEWVFDPFVGASDKEKERDKKKKIAEFNRITQTGDISKDEDKRFVAEMIEWYLSQMTLKENREKAFKIRQNDLYNRIKNSGTARGAKPDARVFMMQTIVEKAPRLFDYHFVARLNAAILLADLSELFEKDQTTHFTKAYEPLIKALKDVDQQNRKQPDAVRVWGVEGLLRIGTLPDVRIPIRNQIIDVFVEQLNDSKNDHEWLQWRLAEALGNLGVAYNSQRQPKVPNALAKVLVDEQRPWIVRVEAAESLGKLPLDRDVDVSFIAREVANLTRQMSDAYKKEPNRPTWKLAFLKLYLAFKPATDEKEKTPKGLLTQVNTNGALSVHKKTVQEAFDMVLPIVQAVLTTPPNIDEPAAKLKDWLAKNPRRTDRIADKESPIIQQSSAPPDQPPAGGGASG